MAQKKTIALPKHLQEDPNELVLTLYVYKRIKDKCKDFEDSVKEFAKKSKKLRDYISEQGLSLVLTDIEGKKSFNIDKAKKFVKQKLGEAMYNTYFTHFVITRKTSDPVPQEIIDNLKLYFDITTVDILSEEKLNTVPHNIPKDLINTNCYDKGEPTIRMTTPTKISDRELGSMFAGTTSRSMADGCSSPWMP